MKKQLGIGLIAFLLFMTPIAFAEYARSDIYIIIPIDTSFQVSTPADYASFTDITGATEAGATAFADIVFNNTALPANMVNPHILGQPSQAQTGPTGPIFRIDNTGNANLDFQIKLSADVPSGMTIMGNATCEGTCTSAMQNPTVFGMDYANLATTVATTGFVNMSLFANFTALTAPNAGASNVTSVFIKSSAS